MEHRFYQVWCHMDSSEWEEKLNWLASTWITDHQKDGVWKQAAVVKAIQYLLHGFEYEQFSVTFYANRDVKEAEQCLNKALYASIRSELDAHIHLYERPQSCKGEEWESIKASMEESKNIILDANPTFLVYIDAMLHVLNISNHIEYFTT